MLAGGVVISAAAVELSGVDIRMEVNAQKCADARELDALAIGRSSERTRHTAVSLRMSQLVAMVLRRAGLDNQPSQAGGFGIISGSHYGCSIVYELHRRLRQFGPRGIDAVYFAQATHSYPLSVCAIEYGFKGPCVAVVGSHKAGLQALMCARDWLEDRRCKRVIVAAYEDINGPVLDCIQAGRGHGRVQEAMALLCLEDRQAALERGAPILAELDAVDFLRTETAGMTDGRSDTLGASGVVDLALILTGEASRPTNSAALVSAVDPFSGGMTAGFRLVDGGGSAPCAR